MKNSTAVWLSRPIYQRYPKTRFASNYGNLKRALFENQRLAAVGRQAYLHDAPVVIQRRINQGRFYYKGSAIQRQLKVDVQHGHTNGKTPAQVLASRSLYQNSGLTSQQLSNFLSYERNLHHKRLHNEEYRQRMEFINTRILTEAEREAEEQLLQRDDNDE